MLEHSHSDEIEPLQVARSGCSSPSFTDRHATATAYEMKFLMPENIASQIQAWARERLMADPHGTANQGDGYATTTLYLDTAAWDVFHRTAGYARNKYRLRRYNDSSTLFMECKRRQGDEVSKQRCAFPLEELPRFSDPLETTWAAAAYHQTLLDKGLRPACRMTYERSAFQGLQGSELMRLTLDRHIRGLRCEAWNASPLESGERILSGEVICELKFRQTLPVLFKELIAEFRLQPAPVSKYRRMLRALGLQPRSGVHV